MTDRPARERVVERRVTPEFVELVKRFKEFRDDLSPEDRRIMTTWLGGGRSVAHKGWAPIIPLEIIYPAPYPAGVGDYDATGVNLRLTVEFIGNVNVASVKPQQTITLATALDQNAAGAVVGVAPTHGGNSAILFTTTKTIDQLLFQGPDAGFTLTLIGTNHGLGVVVDDHGNALDGDGDGVPGGDYVMSLIRIG